MIETTTITYYTPMRHYKVFRQYIADNGKSLYTIDSRIVTKEEGNQEFIDIIKNSERHEIKKVSVESGDAKIVDALDKSIDKYVQYIEDYRQYESACKHNDKIRTIIDAFKEIAE